MVNKKVGRQSHSYQSNDRRCIFGSLSKDEDLMEGILTECEKHGIRSGVVHCIGSLRETGYVLFKTKDDQPSGYTNKIKITQPTELIMGTGFICEDEDQNLDLHMHGLVTKEDGQMSSGHFIRGENPTLITVEFSITYAEDIHAIRAYDDRLGFKVINFSI